MDPKTGLNDPPPFGRVATRRILFRIASSVVRRNCIAPRINRSGRDSRKRANFYVAVPIVDCHRRGTQTVAGRSGRGGDRRRSSVGAETDRVREREREEEGDGWLSEKSGGAFKSGRGRKKGRSRSGGRVYACMRGRDTRPLYERYLMDCIGRAQTLNLTFTIIAALRGDAPAARPARPRGRCDAEGEAGTGGGRAMLDVNFIILAKKLRPGSGPSDRFSRSFCDIPRCPPRAP